MHGHIGNPNDKNMLHSYIEKEGCISTLSAYYEINDNEFLREALNNIYVFLVEIEEAYCKKERENNWKYTINTNIRDEG